MRNRVISVILMASLLIGIVLLPSMTNNVYASNAYKINGVTVHWDDFTSAPDECWAYANNIYNKIWGQSFSNQFNDSSNSLRNLSDSELTLTADHLKAYVSNAALGSCLRICNSEYLHGGDGWGHSLIIVQKDNNGFTVFEGGLGGIGYPYCREKYYTWSNFMSTGYLGGTYSYIKYIKWPGAPAYSGGSSGGGEHTCNKAVYKWEWSAHPHYKCYECSICGTVREDRDEPTFWDSCRECHRPNKPALNGLKSKYSSEDTITFQWDSTTNTTHYNFYIQYKNSSGEWKSRKQIFYAKSGTSYQLPEGEYRAFVQSYNSDFWEEDGSDWIYTQSDYCFFTVAGEHACNKAVYKWEWSAHPHYKCYECSICGTVREDRDEPTFWDSCLECHRPERPELLSIQDAYTDEELIVFKWNPTENTTHYNFYIQYQKANGEWVSRKQIFYAESGTAYQLPPEKYRAFVQSYNSDYWEEDRSDWLHTWSDYVYFSVVASDPCEQSHDYTYRVATAPTVNTDGKLSGSCSRCNETISKTLPMLNTSDYTGTIIKEPTCVADGDIAYTWNTADYGTFTFHVTAEKTGHSYIEVITKPTCTTKGYTIYTCTRCGDSYTGAEKDALGHAWDSGKVTTEPTEESGGIRTYTCTRCGETKTETIPPKNHVHSYTAVITDPTCTEQGYTTYTCTCGHSYQADKTAASGHEYDAEVKEPTCTEEGFTTYTCTRCGDSYTGSEKAALGHGWDNGVETVKPTQTEPGIRTYTCIRCGETKTETIPPLGHKHSFTDQVTPPTCTEAGYTTHTCACGESYKDAYTDALKHSYANGLCIRCGAKDPDYEEPKPGHVCPSEDFADVPPYGNWAHDGIDYCVKAGLMNGTGNGLFNPNGMVSRAQLVTILYRVAGSPTVTTSGTFTDVPAGQWYSNAIEWAAANGVVNGIGNGKFGPDQSITREQIATILYRYEGEPAISGNLNSFPDQGSVSGFAVTGLIWATQEGLITGVSSNGVTTLAPKNNATRAQIASIIMRYLES